MRHDEKTTGWRSVVCDMTRRLRDGGVLYAKTPGWRSDVCDMTRRLRDDVCDMTRRDGGVFAT